MKMNTVELLLSLVPALTHLRLIGDCPDLSNSIFDGSQWEAFIQTKLHLLNKFEFSFTCWKDYGAGKTTYNNMESMIASFQTSFWLETKRWFVTIACSNHEYIQEINVHSIPFCEDDFHYPETWNNISCSVSTTIDNDVEIMENVRHLYLNLDQFMTDVIEERVSIIF